MWNKPSKKLLERVPDLYSTEKIKNADKTIYLHFFICGSDWYIAEISHDDFDYMFGYSILNGDFEMAEWGYISLSELCKINVMGIQVDRDMHWEPTIFKKIPNVKLYEE